MPDDDVTAIKQQPLNVRCLALTGALETSSLPPGCFGCVTGDFDGQGISYSALQWNLGQGTLQPLLIEMNTRHGDVARRAFGDQYNKLVAVLATQRPQQMAWARSIQTHRLLIEEGWSSGFRALGQTAEFQAVAVRHASSLFESGMALCRTLGLKSQRAAALLFDIKVQNGGIGTTAFTLIERDFATLAPGDADVVETAKLRSISNRIADTAALRWREDVRMRKLTVANGAGVVHGVHYDLAAQFGLTMSDGF